jgi:hypothetical protein
MPSAPRPSDAIQEFVITAAIGERLYLVVEKRERGYLWAQTLITKALAADAQARTVVVDDVLEEQLRRVQPDAH